MKRRMFTIVATVLLWALSHAAQAGTVTYVYTDPQGTPLADADTSGNITATYDYRAYGARALDPPTSGPGYTGHVNDADSGFVYMQARYYDPEVARFLSVDPVAAYTNSAAFNRYWYADDNPVKNIDPTGTTCRRSGSDKKYSCQIDYVVTRVKDHLVARKASEEDRQTYAAVEKSLTDAVNEAASSGKTASISFNSGGTNYSFSIAGAAVAKNLASRVINVAPFEKGAMYTSGNKTTVEAAGVQPGRTIFGDANRTRKMEFLHEGIHRSSEEKRAIGISGLIRMGVDQDAHQDSYNAAADSFLGPI